jgi:phosphinothricin acetyltransferase
MNVEKRTARIRDAAAGDADAIAAIYNHYVAESIVTFETEPVAPDDIAGRLAETAALDLPWLVAETGDRAVGFAYASKWKGRCAYRYAVESTIYLDTAETGKGLGAPLYAALLQRIRDASMHTAIAGIALPNEASVRLHERLGFRKIGHFEAVGYKFDRWIDVGYWQLLF